MASTNFVNGVTLTDADWFNDVDRVVYDILNDPTDINDIISSVGSISFTGAIVDIARLTIPSGWLECNGAAIDRTTYADLFAATNTSSAVTLSTGSGKVNWTGHGLLDYMPVKFTTSGSLPTEIVSGRTYWITGKTANDFSISHYPGGTAIATFDATGSGITAISSPYGDGDGSTTFNVPNFSGRKRTTYGSLGFTVSLNGTMFNMSTDVITVPGNTAALVTGMPVVYTVTSGDAITNLTSTTTYYVIRTSATTIQLATTLAEAQAGTARVFAGTVDANDLYALTYTGNVTGYGEFGGEQSHAMSLTEMLAHTHDKNLRLFTVDNGSAVTGVYEADPRNAGNTQSRGGNAAMNVLDPFYGVRTVIKT